MCTFFPILSDGEMKGESTQPTKLLAKEKKTIKAIEMHTMTLENLLDKFLAKRQLVRVVKTKN
jgi:hypothetical protein